MEYEAVEPEATLKVVELNAVETCTPATGEALLIATERAGAVP